MTLRHVAPILAAHRRRRVCNIIQPFRKWCILRSQFAMLGRVAENSAGNTVFSISPLSPRYQAGSSRKARITSCAPAQVRRLRKLPTNGPRASGPPDCLESKFRVCDVAREHVVGSTIRVAVASKIECPDLEIVI